MKKYLFYLILIAVGIILMIAPSFAQTVQYQGTPYSKVMTRGIYGADSGLVITPSDTFNKSLPAGTIRFLTDFSEFVFTGTYWKYVNAPSLSAYMRYMDTVSVSDRINAKQATLVSGTNIKTINGTSLLGSGDITISGGGTATDTSYLRADIEARVKYTDTPGMLGPYATDAQLADSAAALRTLANTKQNSLSGTGFVKASGSTISYDNSTYLTSYTETDPLAVKLGDSATKYSTIKRLADSSAAIRASIPTVSDKQSFSDTTTWDATKKNLIDTAAAIQGRINLKIDSIRRLPGSTTVQMKINGTWITAFTDSVGGGSGGGADANAWHITGDTATVNKIFGTTSTISSHRIDFKVGNEIVGYMGWTTGGFRYGSFMSRTSTALNYDALCLGGEGHISTGIRSVTIGGVGTKALGTNAIGMGGGAAESNNSWAWGSQNTYANGENSVAFGSYATNNGFTGCFNWSDNSESSFSNNTANNQVMFKPAGGFVIKTAASGTTPLSNAALEVISTTKAFYPPRMTTTQRDAMAGVQAGAVIYNSTTNKHQGYDGTTWNDLY